MSSFNAYYSHVHTVSQTVRQHLPSIEWLVSMKDGDRRTGRTTALALAFLRESFSGSFATVKIFDHFLVDRVGSAGEEVRNKVKEMYHGVFIDSEGRIEPQPCYPGDNRSPQFSNTLQSVRTDFRDVCHSAVRLGIDPVWMMDQIRNAVAESVMAT